MFPIQWRLLIITKYGHNVGIMRQVLPALSHCDMGWGRGKERIFVI